MYKQISNYLNERNLKSVRGKPFSAKLVERMDKKKLIKIDRENKLKVRLISYSVIFK